MLRNLARRAEQLSNLPRPRDIGYLSYLIVMSRAGKMTLLKEYT